MPAPLSDTERDELARRRQHDPDVDRDTMHRREAAAAEARRLDALATTNAALKAAQDAVDAPDDPHEADGPDEPTERQRSAYSDLLAHNGYNAVRHQALGAVEAIAGLPLETLEAALDFARTTAARLRLDTDPRAPVAVVTLEGEVELLRIVTNTRRALERLEKQQAARDAITRR